MKLNLNNINLKISAGQLKQFPRDPIPQVAFSGRSNVGKSSLINSLMGRKSMARVSSTPGKTITINFYDLDHKLFFVDLPGYGYAKRDFSNKETWSTLTDSYFTKNPNRDLLKVVIQLIDSKVGPTDDDTMMIQWLSDHQIPFILVCSKADKLKVSEKDELLDFLKNDYLKEFQVPIILYSSEKNIGRQELWDLINEAVD